MPQPAEEDAHAELGPFGGAHEMVAAGVLDAPRVDQVHPIGIADGHRRCLGVRHGGHS